MTYSLWLFPLLAGYLIISKFIYLKYKYQRLGSQRLIFHSALAGILVFAGIYCLRILVSSTLPNVIPHLYRWFYSIPLDEQPMLLTSVLCLAVVLVLLLIINWVLKKFDYFNFRKPVHYAVDEFGDELEQLFKLSAINKLLLQITLKNRKVYVGYTDKIPPPQESNYLKIVPVLSGYRDSSSLEIVFTTEYFKALKKYQEDPEKYQSFEMDTVIMQDEILTARNFDQDIFENFAHGKERNVEEDKSKKVKEE